MMDFIMKYMAYIYCATAFNLNRMDHNTIMRHVIAAKETAGGMDGWTMGDLKILSTTSFI